MKKYDEKSNNYLGNILKKYIRENNLKLSDVQEIVELNKFKISQSYISESIQGKERVPKYVYENLFSIFRLDLNKAIKEIGVLYSKMKYYFNRLTYDKNYLIETTSNFEINKLNELLMIAFREDISQVKDSYFEVDITKYLGVEKEIICYCLAKLYFISGNFKKAKHFLEYIKNIELIPIKDLLNYQIAIILENHKEALHYCCKNIKIYLKGIFLEEFNVTNDYYLAMHEQNNNSFYNNQKNFNSYFLNEDPSLFEVDACEAGTAFFLNLQRFKIDKIDILTKRTKSKLYVDMLQILKRSKVNKNNLGLFIYNHFKYIVPKNLIFLIAKIYIDFEGLTNKEQNKLLLDLLIA